MADTATDQGKSEHLGRMEEFRCGASIGRNAVSIIDHFSALEHTSRGESILRPQIRSIGT